MFHCSWKKVLYTEELPSVAASMKIGAGVPQHIEQPVVTV
jgi:hypothetical protein